jgi:hypothetical protein
MRQDMATGAQFPDYILPDHTKTPVACRISKAISS